MPDQQQKEPDTTPIAENAVTNSSPENVVQPTETIQPPNPAPPQPIEPTTNFSYSGNADDSVDIPEDKMVGQPAETIEWTASEFHVHDKSLSWYLLLLISTALISAILYFLSKSIVTLVVVILGGLTIGIYGRHKPGNIEYALSSHGLRVGTKQYVYDEFRLFTITPDPSLPEITLIPVKRFMPSLSVLYNNNDEDKIITMLSNYLPVEEKRPDPLDRLMHKIHF